MFLQLSIDPRGLERGRVYFTSVKAYCAANVEKGCMFEVPITVVVPCVELHHGYQYSWSVYSVRYSQIIYFFSFTVCAIIIVILKILIYHS